MAFDRYGVDAVMVGRATFGAPWVFKEMREAIETHPNPLHKGEENQQLSPFTPSLPSLGEGLGVALTLNDKIDILLEQLHINIERIGERRGIINIERIGERRGIIHTRRHLASTPIFKGIPDFRQTRIAMLRAETADELTAIMEQCRRLLSQS